MNRLAIRAVHDPALGKAKSLLIKAHSSRYVGDGEHSRYGAVLLLVEWINFLLSHGAPFSKTHMGAGDRGLASCAAPQIRVVTWRMADRLSNRGCRRRKAWNCTGFCTDCLHPAPTAGYWPSLGDSLEVVE